VLPPTCDVTPAARFFPEKFECSQANKLCALLGLGSAPVENKEDSPGVIEAVVEEIKVNPCGDIDLKNGLLGLYRALTRR
jgi:hypothetical protein